MKLPQYRLLIISSDTRHPLYDKEHEITYVLGSFYGLAQGYVALSRWIDNLLYKMRKRRFCKLNRFFCPDCIYHDFIFEGAIFRGNKCRYPRHTKGEEE